MNAPFPDFGSARAGSTGSANVTSMRWAALGEAGRVVAMLAGLEAERPDRNIRDFPERIGHVENWRRDLIDNGCADLAAVMEPGIATLLAVNARGGDCRPAALALWREFVTARAGMLALLPPASGRDPQRGA